MNLAGDTSFYSFLWDGEKLTDLGTFGGARGHAAWINDAGRRLAPQSMAMK
jgi:hypothetical protein